VDTCAALPATGADLLPLAIVAALLLLAGGAALLVTRRRGRTVLGALALTGFLVAGLSFAAPQSASAASCDPAPPVAAVNHAPIAAADSATVVEDAAPATVAGNVLTNDTDVDGDALTVTGTGTFVLNHGTLVISADGSFSYTLDNTDPAVDALDAGDVLSDGFAYAISDGHGGTAGATLTITIDGTTNNSAPVAFADANTVKEDAAPNPVSGNVLTNDSDPDGHTLSVTNGGTFALGHGTLVMNANGSYTYMLDNSNPAVNAMNDGQFLNDGFTYTVSDGHGGTASTTLTIRVNGTTDNTPPIALADTNTVKEDAAPNPVTGNVLTNDSDPDGNTLAVANAGTVTLTYGTLVINANGTYTYTLDNANPAVNAMNDGQIINDTFTYTVSDGHGGTASTTLTIRINGTTDLVP
jgi:LPXTG-motif cell wall-anchored protein